MEIKTVGIIGQGALGVMYGKHLTDRLGNQNVFFIADEGRVERYRAEGATCNGEICDFSYRSPKEAAAVDLLVFAVKAMGLASAIETARPFVGGNTLILSVLNGISSEEFLVEAFGEEHVLYACVQGMDAVKEGNKVSYKNMGYIAVGNKDNSHDDRLKAVTEFFEKAGLAYEVPENILQKQWSKLMLNTGVNQVTAVYRAPYALIQKEGEARTMMTEAMKEVKKVAESQGITLTDEDIEYWHTVADGLNPEGYTSMCQDVLAGRPTEVELFAGTMIRLAKEAELSVPVNEFLYERLKEGEQE